MKGTLTEKHMGFEVAGFADGGAIPDRFTADGLDVSPALKWTGVPEIAAELVIIVEDPDAPRDRPFVHWLAYKIPTDADGLKEALLPTARVESPAGMMQGRNDFGKLGYGGPAPPRGHGVHHYHFRLYALDTKLNIGAGCRADELQRAMRGHVLTEADYVGTYERRR
ncbi:MAG TPA: YbhB/YbcL family Raf kinase inhibitor-like protein [Phycisphaerae bacterium]|nr:YbhB/YbcL family Raf kinase inhibitor-like protein [Phycisphaerae bacterium]